MRFRHSNRSTERCLGSLRAGWGQTEMVPPPACSDGADACLARRLPGERKNCFAGAVVSGWQESVLTRGERSGRVRRGYGQPSSIPRSNPRHGPHSTEPAGPTARPRSADIGSGRSSGCSSPRWRRRPDSRRSGSLPPSIKLKPFAHATASTELVVGESRSFRHSCSRPLRQQLSAARVRARGHGGQPRGREVRRAGGRSPRLEDRHLGATLDRAPAIAAVGTGSKAGQSDHHRERPVPHHPDVQTQSPPWPPVIDVETQAPNTETAARLATAVVSGLNAYVSHLQTATGVPEPDRYEVSQLAPVSVAPARTSQLANVGVFTFVAVFVLWCGVMVAVSSLMRDLRAHRRPSSKVGSGLDRSSDSRPVLVGTD